jgi:hypothetical protein
MNRTTWIIGAAALVVLLVAAAFVGGQLLSTEAAAGASPLQAVAGQPAAQSGASAQGPQAFNLEMETASEVPQTEPDVAGLLARRGDKSIFVTTGQVVMAVGMNPDGTLSVQGSADGPEVEVVIPHTAQVYVDTTEFALAGGGKIKQTVEPGSVDEIGKNSMISVWGERRGDRVIAHTVLYTAPDLSAIPNPN